MSQTFNIGDVQVTLVEDGTPPFHPRAHAPPFNISQLSPEERAVHQTLGTRWDSQRAIAAAWVPERPFPSTWDPPRSGANDDSGDSDSHSAGHISDANVKRNNRAHPSPSAIFQALSHPQVWRLETERDWKCFFAQILLIRVIGPAVYFPYSQPTSSFHRIGAPNVRHTPIGVNKVIADYRVSDNQYDEVRHLEWDVEQIARFSDHFFDDEDDQYIDFKGGARFKLGSVKFSKLINNQTQILQQVRSRGTAYPPFTDKQTIAGRFRTRRGKRYIGRNILFKMASDRLRRQRHRFLLGQTLAPVSGENVPNGIPADANIWRNGLPNRGAGHPIQLGPGGNWAARYQKYNTWNLFNAYLEPVVVNEANALLRKEDFQMPPRYTRLDDYNVGRIFRLLILKVLGRTTAAEWWPSDFDRHGLPHDSRPNRGAAFKEREPETSVWKYMVIGGFYVLCGSENLENRRLTALDRQAKEQLAQELNNRTPNADVLCLCNVTAVVQSHPPILQLDRDQIPPNLRREHVPAHLGAIFNQDPDFQGGLDPANPVVDAEETPSVLASSNVQPDASSTVGQDPLSITQETVASVPPPTASVPPPAASVPPPTASVPPPTASVPPPAASVPPPTASVPHVVTDLPTAVHLETSATPIEHNVADDTPMTGIPSAEEPVEASSTMAPVPMELTSGSVPVTEAVATDTNEVQSNLPTWAHEIFSQLNERIDEVQTQLNEDRVSLTHYRGLVDELIQTRSQNNQVANPLAGSSSFNESLHHPHPHRPASLRSVDTRAGRPGSRERSSLRVSGQDRQSYDPRTPIAPSRYHRHPHQIIYNFPTLPDYMETEDDHPSDR